MSDQTTSHAPTEPNGVPTEGRRQRHWLLRVLASGPFIGVAFFVLMFAQALLSFGGAEYMGVKDAAVTREVVQNFWGEIVRRQLEIGAISVALGLVLGLFAQLTWWLVGALRRRPFALLHQVGLNLFTVLLFHGYFLARAVLNRPQIYAESFYDRGGFLASLQVWITDSLPMALFDGLAIGYGSLLALGLLLLGLRKFRDQRSSTNSKLAIAGTGAVVALALVFLAFGRPAVKPQLGPTTPQKPNVIFIAVDSLRFDRIDGGGPRAGITPTIDALARSGTHFTRTYTVMPRTFPSFISVLTGQYPHRHGIRHMFPAPGLVDKKRNSLGQILRKNGYQTAVITDYAGDIFARIKMGYSKVEVPEFTLRAMIRISSFKIHSHLFPYLIDIFGRDLFPVLRGFERLADPSWLTNDAIKWLDRRESAKPFFLTLFYSTPHFPFSAPYPYYRAYTKPSYRGKFKYHKSHYGQHPGPEDIKQIRRLYDGCVWAVDHQLQRLFAHLERLGIRKNTAIVLFSDHGENLYERNYGVTHGEHLFGEYSTRIPLVIDFPGSPGRGKRVSQLTRSIDIMPTILDLLGLRRPKGLDGTSLKPMMQGKRLRLRAFLETGVRFPTTEATELDRLNIRYASHFEQFKYDLKSTELWLKLSYEPELLLAKHRALIDGRYKLIYIPSRSGVYWGLFDLLADPSESNNLIKKLPQLSGKLKLALKNWVLTDPRMTTMGDFFVPRRSAK